MAEKVSEKDENLIELFIKNGLNAEGKKLWDVIIVNPSIVIERDFINVQLLIECYQDFHYLKKQLKLGNKPADFPSPRVKENTNETQQIGWAVSQMNEKIKLIIMLTKELGLSAMSSANLKQLENNDMKIIADLLKSDR